MNNRVYYTCYADAESFSATTPDEAIGEYLHEMAPEDWPEKVTVYEYRPQKIGWSNKTIQQEALNVLGGFLGTLDEEYGNYNDPSEPTRAMQDAAKVLVRTVLHKYKVWRCERVGQQAVDAHTWVREHKPHWLEDA